MLLCWEEEDQQIHCSGYRRIGSHPFFHNRNGKPFGSPCFNILNPKLALQNEWSSHQVCWLTNLFWHWFLCAPALRWFVSVGREWARLIELATHRAPNSWRWSDIFYSRCQREADAFHLQWDKFLERALFFIYIAAYLCRCSLVSPSCNEILWDKHLPPCAVVAALLWEGQGTNDGNDAEWSKTEQAARHMRRHCL